MRSELDRTRELVLHHGWNTTCYQIVNSGIERWLADDAVVGYVDKYGVRVVAGAPVCAEGELGATMRRFEWESGNKVCYFGAEERVHRHASESSRYSTSVLGAQPVWSPESWRRAIQSSASLRAQLNRSRSKGVTVREWDASDATGSPQLQEILTYWLATRGLPPMHFLVEPETLGLLLDRRVFVAERQGVPVAFTVFAPIPERNGFLTEQFVRGKGAPNGTVELMVSEAIKVVGRDGAEMVTMGMVPLSRKVPASPTDPGWLRFTMNWVRAHGRRFYDSDGLEWFKNKFKPDRWDPIYAISTERRFSFRTLYAIAGAFTGMPPWLAVLRGGLKAVRKEAHRFVRP